MTKRRREPRADAARARTDLPLRERVTRLLDELGRPASLRDLGRKLDLGRDERRELEPLLERLIEAGELVRIRDDRIGLPSHMNLVVGRLQCSPAGFGFVVPEKRAAGEKDVYVSAGQPQGGAARRPRGGAAGEERAQRPGGPRHPRAGAQPAAPGGPLRGRRPLRRARGARSTGACCTSC